MAGVGFSGPIPMFSGVSNRTKIKQRIVGLIFVGKKVERI